MGQDRRFRGIVGMSAIWGVALSALATTSLAVGLATGLVPSGIFGAREMIAVAIRGFAAGALGGGLFAWLVARRERSKALSSVSSHRMALWGFLAAGSVPAIVALAAGWPALPIGILAASSVIAGAGGSALSVAILRLARCAPEQIGGSNADRHLLP
jgi:hypothetical protein